MPARLRSTARCVAGAFALVALLAQAAAAQIAGSESGLPVPRYVSLKADRVNVRSGPSRTHDVSWVFTRSGIPVEIVAETENWRRIRDAEGAEGWVYHSLLSGRRTVLVAPASPGEIFVLRAEPQAQAPALAKLYARVQANVRQCDGKWCRISGNGFDGYVEQHRLWGVYPNEAVH
jgi:SH3-like domain-containing protein